MADRRLTILNVDDYGPGRYSRSRTLRNAGFDVIEATTGRDALASLHEHKPQMVVLDVNLPDMSGIDVCRQIKQDPATAHVIVLHLSATSVGVDSKVAGLASGCDGYLTEPVDAEELIAHVNALLRLKRAEEELRETNATLGALFDALPLAVVATDPEGRVTRWSPSAARVFGWSEEDVIGGTNPAIPPAVEPEYSGRASRALDGESIVGFETQMRRKDGAVVPVNVSLGPLRSRDGAISGTLAVVEDITARKHAEREMARLYQEAGRASRVKDEFLATLSHELRTPLNAMRVWVHLLRRGEVPPDRIDSALEIIDRNTTAQVRLIEDILDVSRIVSGKLRLQQHPVDVRRVVAAAAADMVRPVAASKNQRLVVSAGDRPALVLGDSHRLQQVVTNLLSNGVKFTPPGGTVSVSVAINEPHVTIEVHDTGAGIEEKFLPHVFERFSQADSTTSRLHGGLGLGLAIVSHLVELHGGRVAAESPGLGQGSTFRVILPLTVAVDAIEKPPAEHSADLHGLDILVVDDDADAREPLEMLLASRGARVRVSSSASQALEAYSQRRPHVLVADLGMPGEDGFALLGRLRAMDPSFPVYAIALSGYAAEDDRTRALAAGFHEHLAKPMDVGRLMTALSRSVDDRRP